MITHNVLAMAGHPKENHKTDPLLHERFAETYSRLGADLIVLQEAPPENVVQGLARTLGMNYCYFSAKWPGNKEYPYGFPGALLTRYEILDHQDFVADSTIPDSLFQRHLGLTKLHLGRGDTAYVLQTHLCANFGGRFRSHTRIAEVKVLSRIIDQLPSHQALFLVGDMNTRQGSPAYDALEDLGLAHWSGRPDKWKTVPIEQPKYAIDHIFYRPGSGWSAKSGRCFGGKKQKGQLNYLSDHLGVAVTFTH